ncbi:MAG: GNAT family N-acetyltransferase [Candidatus Thermoplasmatota archaeon]|nr:GNAT family N-acetyltransferase [Candidatus Thermoplasmatota archaeon]MBS3789685.1 GNAT family N-acetyltransferase [Candidatus Thermoplasmatota archaeon]
MVLDIRKAKKDDLDEIVKMWYSLASTHQKMMRGYELAEDCREKWKKFVENGLEKKGMCTFVAEEGNQLVGFLNVVIRERIGIFEETHVGMILDVFIKKDKRGEGIGTQLTERAESWIRKKGVSIAVLTVSPENKKAVKFWEETGYETYLLKKRKKLI